MDKNSLVALKYLRTLSSIRYCYASFTWHRFRNECFGGAVQWTWQMFCGQYVTSLNAYRSNRKKGQNKNNQKTYLSNVLHRTISEFDGCVCVFFSVWPMKICEEEEKKNGSVIVLSMSSQHVARGYAYSAHRSVIKLVNIILKYYALVG